jgi:LysR family transcriptional regulator, low CO2-responsive transcriptional regulator
MPSLRDASLRQLQLFASAASTSSFSRTAKAMHLSQPAVSMQMRQLEDLAGQPLFERVGRRLFLTDAGRELARHARDVLRCLEAADESLTALLGLRAGRVRIGVTSTAKYFAPKLIALFSADNPHVTIELRVNNRDSIDTLLADNELDLALMGRPPEGLDTVVAPFADHPLVIIAPPGHPLARQRRPSLADVAREPFLVREPGSGTRAAMERFFAAAGLTPPVRMELPSNETIKQAVMAGMGLSFISRHTIGLELETRRLALVRAPGLPVVRTWNVVHLRSKRPSAAATAFEAFVLEHGRAFLARF